MIKSIFMLWTGPDVDGVLSFLPPKKVTGQTSTHQFFCRRDPSAVDMFSNNQGCLFFYRFLCSNDRDHRYIRAPCTNHQGTQFTRRHSVGKFPYYSQKAKAFCLSIACVIILVLFVLNPILNAVHSFCDFNCSSPSIPAKQQPKVTTVCCTLSDRLSIPFSRLLLLPPLAEFDFSCPCPVRREGSGEWKNVHRRRGGIIQLPKNISPSPNGDQTHWRTRAGGYSDQTASLLNTEISTVRRLSKHSIILRWFFFTFAPPAGIFSRFSAKGGVLSFAQANDCSPSGVQDFSQCDASSTNCLCSCKSGFHGRTCSEKEPRFIILGTGSSRYVMEYVSVCSNIDSTFSDATSRCASLNHGGRRGWTLASDVSPSTRSTLNSLFRKPYFIGATSSSILIAGSVRWLNHGGRHAGGTVMTYGLGLSSCQQSACYFKEYPSAGNMYAEVAPDASPLDSVWMLGGNTKKLRCFACERSPCLKQSDIDKYVSLNRTTRFIFPSCDATATPMLTMTRTEFASSTLTETLLVKTATVITESSTLSNSLVVPRTITNDVSQTLSELRSRTITQTVTEQVSVTRTEHHTASETVTARSSSQSSTRAHSVTLSYLDTASQTHAASLTATLTTSNSATISTSSSHSQTLTFMPTPSRRTPSPSLSLHPSGTFTKVLSFTPTQNQSTTFSIKHTQTVSSGPTNTFVAPPTLSLEPLGSVSLSLTLSYSVSPSDDTLSAVLTASDGPLPTLSLNLTVSDAPHLTLTQEISESSSKTFSSSLERTVSCDEGDVPRWVSNTTCYIVTPTTKSNAFGEVHGKDERDPFTMSRARFEKGCDFISLSYDAWTGREGAVLDFYFKFNSSWGEMRSLTTEGPTLMSAVPDAQGSGDMGTNAGVGRATKLPLSFSILSYASDAGNYSYSVSLRYNGDNTMASPGTMWLQLPSTALKCPLGAPLIFTILPLPAPKSEFEWISEIIKTIVDVMSIVSATPAVAAQMGIVNGLQQLARCEKADLEEEMDFMNSPLGLSLGNPWGGPSRGCLAGTFVIVLAFTGVLGMIGGAYYLVVLKVGPGEGRAYPPTWASALAPLGIPGVYLIIAAFLMDATFSSGVSLILFGVDTLDIIYGIVGCCACMAYIAAIFYTTTRAFLTVRKGNGDEDDEDEVAEEDTNKKDGQGGVPTTEAPLGDAFDRIRSSFDSDLAAPLLLFTTNGVDEEAHHHGRRRGLDTNGMRGGDGGLPQGTAGAASEEMADLIIGRDSAEIDSILLDDQDGAIISDEDDDFDLYVNATVTVVSHNYRYPQPERILSFSRTPAEMGPRDASQGVGGGYGISESSPRTFLSRLKSWLSVRGLLRVPRILRPSESLHGNKDFMGRYGHYVADLRAVASFRAMELVAVCIINGLQSAAYGKPIVCIIELCVATAALIFLLVIVVVKGPMSVPFERRCTALSLGLQAIAALIMLANIFVLSSALDNASVIVIMFATIVTLVQAAAGMFCMVIDNIEGLLRFIELIKSLWRAHQRHRLVLAEEKARRIILELAALEGERMVFCFVLSFLEKDISPDVAFFADGLAERELGGGVAAGSFGGGRNEGSARVADGGHTSRTAYYENSSSPHDDDTDNSSILSDNSDFPDDLVPNPRHPFRSHACLAAVSTAATTDSVGLADATVTTSGTRDKNDATHFLRMREDKERLTKLRALQKCGAFCLSREKDLALLPQALGVPCTAAVSYFEGESAAFRRKGRLTDQNENNKSASGEAQDEEEEMSNLALPLADSLSNLYGRRRRDATLSGDVDEDGDEGVGVFEADRILHMLLDLERRAVLEEEETAREAHELAQTTEKTRLIEAAKSSKEKEEEEADKSRAHRRFPKNSKASFSLTSFSGGVGGWSDREGSASAKKRVLDTVESFAIDAQVVGAYIPQTSSSEYSFNRKSSPFSLRETSSLRFVSNEKESEESNILSSGEDCEGSNENVRSNDNGHEEWATTRGSQGNEDIVVGSLSAPSVRLDLYVVNSFSENTYHLKKARRETKYNK